MKLFVAHVLLTLLLPLFSTATSPLKELPLMADPLTDWINTSLRWPFKEVSSDSSGFPVYNGTNAAEGCPANLSFACSRCAGGCDSSTEATDFRPCKSQTRNPSRSCFPVPHQPWERNDNKRNLAPTTRLNILQRASGWLSCGFQYMWRNTKKNTTAVVMSLEACGKSDNPSQCPAFRYMLDCDGFVKMSWAAPPGHSLNSNADQVKCADMQPGDAISHYAAGDHHFLHAQLFREWKGPAGPGGSRQWVIWQMGGGSGKVNQAQGRFSPDSESQGLMKCWARKNVK